MRAERACTNVFVCHMLSCDPVASRLTSSELEKRAQMLPTIEISKSRPLDQLGKCQRERARA